MKSAPPELVALLNAGGPYYMADLLTLTLIDGTVARYSLWDTNLTYNGHSFSGVGPAIERSRVRTVIGFEVDTLDLTIHATAAHTINGVPILKAAARGMLDGATVLLERVFLNPSDLFGPVVGGYINFSGRVADMTVTRAEARVVVKSDIELLNIQMPKNLYQPGCQHTLYDADCGINRASVATSATVGAGSSTTTLNAAQITQAAGWFDLGYIVFTSGALAGTKRTIKAGTPGAVSLLNPLPQAPAPGDAFTAYPGCDKTMTTCSAKFSNLANFRGFPFIPVPETTR